METACLDVALLIFSGLASLVGASLLALSQKRYLHLTRHDDPGQRKTLYRGGMCLLTISLMCCLSVLGSGFVALAWPLQLALSVWLVALSLAFRPRLVALNAALIERVRDHGQTTKCKKRDD